MVTQRHEDSVIPMPDSYCKQSMAAGRDHVYDANGGSVIEQKV